METDTLSPEQGNGSPKSEARRFSTIPEVFSGVASGRGIVAPDEYTVPDFPYNAEVFSVEQSDRFKGYRALEIEDRNVWLQAVEDASS
jgi:hypothetical protein